MRFVEGYDKLPYRFANTFEILDIVSSITIDHLTQNIFLHSMQWVFNIFDIGGQMLHWPIQRDCSKFTIPRILVHSLIGVVIQLDVNYVSVVIHSVIVEDRYNILSMLLPHIGDCVSHLADTRCLPWRGYIFELGAFQHCNRVILNHVIAFSLHLIIVKIKECGLSFFFILILFSFQFIFIFLFLELWD